jgi:hypothetical protein
MGFPLCTGGMPVGRIGYPLHCRLRYFDLHARRAGLPSHLAALVEAMDADSVTVQLVNTSSTLEQTVVLQGGAYGEHALTSVTISDLNGASTGAATPIRADDGLGNSAFAATIQPGCAGRLKIGPSAYCRRRRPTALAHLSAVAVSCLFFWRSVMTTDSASVLGCAWLHGVH